MMNLAKTVYKHICCLHMMEGQWQLINYLYTHLKCTFCLVSYNIIGRLDLMYRHFAFSSTLKSIHTGNGVSSHFSPHYTVARIERLVLITTYGRQTKTDSTTLRLFRKAEYVVTWGFLFLPGRKLEIAFLSLDLQDSVLVAGGSG